MICSFFFVSIFRTQEVCQSFLRQKSITNRENKTKQRRNKLQIWRAQFKIIKLYSGTSNFCVLWILIATFNWLSIFFVPYFILSVKYNLDRLQREMLSVLLQVSLNLSQLHTLAAVCVTSYSCSTPCQAAVCGATLPVSVLSFRILTLTQLLSPLALTTD